MANVFVLLPLSTRELMCGPFEPEVDRQAQRGDIAWVQAGHAVYLLINRSYRATVELHIAAQLPWMPLCVASSFGFIIIIDDQSRFSFPVSSGGGTWCAVLRCRVHRDRALQDRTPVAATTAAIGTALPSYNCPTSVPASAPQPNWAAPNRADAVPARCGNLTQAARMLQVRQPTLTVALQRLEAEVGTTLFLRNRSGVTLTSTGKTFLQYVPEALALLNVGVQHVQGLETDDVGSFILGFPVALGSYFLLR